MKNNLEEIKKDALFYINKQIEKLDIRERQKLFINCIMVYDKTFYDLINSSESETIHFYNEILHYGFPVFISLLYDEKFEMLIGVPISPIDNERLKFCRSILYACKTIGWINRIMENSHYGNMKVYNFGNMCRVKFSKKYHWNEYFEKKYIEYYSNIIAWLQKDSYSKLQDCKESIVNKMQNMVFVWLNDFMGYNNDIEIEEYFHEYALLDTNQDTEWDMFDEQDYFHNIQYRKYIDTVIDFSGYAIKHINFAIILSQKNPELILENLTYNCLEYKKMQQLVVENQSISSNDAEFILKCLILDSSNKSLYKTSNPYPAPFIKISQNQYIRSIAGVLDHPFIFMLENLHNKCPKDWDKNAMHRESLFKTQLYSLFETEGNNYICIKNNVKIIINGNIVTDIDATIIDKSSGDIAFFQLKWQDHTANSVRSLSSKAKNYKKTTIEWLNAINSWLNNCSIKELSDKLGIKEKYINKDKIHIFVLGRRHGNYSDNTKYNDKCVWVQWYQLIASLQYLKDSTQLITDLYDLIKKSSPFEKRFIERPEKYEYGKRTIIYGGNL